MKNTCKTCERTYRIPPPFIDGQEIVCPYCGATNVYHTPTRIELPVDANFCSRQKEEESVLIGRDQKIASTGGRDEDIASTGRDEDIASTGGRDEDIASTGRGKDSASTGLCDSAAELQPVSRLHVIRPSDSAGRGASPGGDNALVARVRSRARAEGRRAILRKIGIALKDLFWIAVLAVLVLGGWKVFRIWQKSSARTRANVQAQQQAKPTEPTVRPESEVSESPTAKPVRPKPAEPAPSPTDALKTLKDARVSFYGLLPPTERLGTAEGEFVVVVPYGNKISRCYVVESCATGLVSAVRIPAPSELRDSASTGECEAELRRQGGFVVRSGVAYHVTRPNAPKVWNPPLESGGEFCASKAYFGSAHELVRQYGWKMDDLRFEISLVFGKPENSASVATVRFGEKTYHSSFRKVAEPIAQKIRTRNLPRPKTRTYRPTVVFSDGPLIGSNLKGVTKVPRKSQFVQGPEYLRWLKLSEEAERQERECRRIQRENEDSLREWENKLKAPATEDEIRKVLMASSVKIVRKQEALGK